MNERYWKDYTEFITTTERLTNLSPARLLDLYEELILSFEEADAAHFFEEQYEIDNDFLIRDQINQVLTEASLQNNALYRGFKQQVEELDQRIKPFLLIDELSEKHWWRAYKINFAKIK